MFLSTNFYRMRQEARPRRPPRLLHARQQARPTSVTTTATMRASSIIIYGLTQQQEIQAVGTGEVQEDSSVAFLLVLLALLDFTRGLQSPDLGTA